VHTDNSPLAYQPGLFVSFLEGNLMQWEIIILGVRRYKQWQLANRQASIFRIPRMNFAFAFKRAFLTPLRKQISLPIEKGRGDERYNEDYFHTCHASLAVDVLLFIIIPREVTKVVWDC